MIELIATNDSRAMRNKNNVLDLHDLMINADHRAEHSACEYQRRVLTANAGKAN